LTAQVTNDDGPPSNQSSPYVHSLVKTLQSAGHTVSVVLPHIQRSWIGKAHIIGQTLTPSYFRPGTLHEDDGKTSHHPFDDGKEEWTLIDGTPASCVQIGIWHLFRDRGPVDLVVSGPNYGRNTTALFSLSSGTVGGALEAAVCGKKAIALSYAFESREHDPEIIAGASQMSQRLIEQLSKEWPEDVHLYSVNVPLRENVKDAKVLYTDMLQNRWTSGSSFDEVEVDEDADPGEQEKDIREGERNGNINGEEKGRMIKRKQKKFKWAPKFTDVHESVRQAEPGNDGWAVKEGIIRYAFRPQFLGSKLIPEASLR
jgi:tubulin---tyrosine ligase